MLAGQRPGVDPLARVFGETCKARVPIVGLPMVARVTRALLGSDNVDRVVILTQRPEQLPEAALRNPKVEIRKSGDGISLSILQSTTEHPDEWPLLITTADHPLLTTAMVDTFIERTRDAELAVAVVERNSFVAAGRESRRTWLKFRDGAFSGANLFALRNAKSHAALRLWAGAEQDRKRVIKLLSHFGPMLVVRALTRTIGLDEALRGVGARLGLDARLVILDEPEAAIDVDKISDYRLAETILVAREMSARHMGIYEFG